MLINVKGLTSPSVRIVELSVIPLHTLDRTIGMHACPRADDEEIATHQLHCLIVEIVEMALSVLVNHEIEVILVRRNFFE